MRKTKRVQTSLLTVSLVFSISFAGHVGMAAPGRPGPVADGQQQGPRRHVDLVIAIDTSGSMNGLIDSARQKLWDVVNLLAQARPQPILRVGLISYGNVGYDAKGGWVRMDSELTTDLDGIYAKLFRLSTNGGTEYVARAVSQATSEMKWDQDPKTLKILFVAGNEPANQDPLIPVETAVARARERGIFVNTVYCGSESAPESLLWRKVAKSGAGEFAAIDQNHVVSIAAPQDRELARLSTELNQTYVAYGNEGEEKVKNQAAQDVNARKAGPMAAASRAQAKSGALYDADGWDLVDARAHKGVKVADMPASELPRPMKEMKPAEREAFLDGKAKQRDELKKKIAGLATERDRFLKAERTRRSRSGAKALDDALGSAVRTEAISAGFAF